ncbi:MAG: diguanylate cyclase [Gammaproteobacteria bacterium]
MRHRISVLIVDHSKFFRTMLTNLLERYNCSSFSCSSGTEACTLLETHRYDLICAAYHLSDMSGEDFCRHVRSRQRPGNTRVVLFTAEDDRVLLKQALLAGATDIFCKRQFDQFKIYLQRLADDTFGNLIGQVLLVEDSLSQFLWIKAMLAERGLEVDTFSNAQRALSAFLENYYDLVITDIVLDGPISGLALVREIRRNSTDKGFTPVLALSAYDDISRRIELYHTGVSDYMTQPIIEEELLYRAANLIRNHRIVNELNKERQHLKELALLDPVTNLYNRNAFDMFAAKELATAERSRSPISLAIMDIDHFKKINDTFGHEAGDKVLADVGLWLRNSLRKGDMVFRWGGEEFVIILNNCTPLQALDLLDRQRQRFNKRKYADLSLTASFGISGVRDFEHTASVKQLFREADEAVYLAKASGRNQVCLYSERAECRQV